MNRPEPPIRMCACGCACACVCACAYACARVRVRARARVRLRARARAYVIINHIVTLRSSSILRLLTGFQLESLASYLN